MTIAEPVSSLTHLGGAVVSVLASVFLLHRGRGEARRMVALVVFVGSCVLLFTLSGLYHLAQPGTAARTILQRLDHAAIFILIAGTFTPPHAILFRGRLRVISLVVIWCGALLGVLVKVLWFEEIPHWLGLLMYLGMGWTAVVSSLVLWWKHGWSAMLPFVRPVYLGAMAYSVGGVLEALRWPHLASWLGPHEFFHVLVLMGAACYWRFIHMIAGGVVLPDAETRRLEHLRRLRRQAGQAVARVQR